MAHLKHLLCYRSTRASFAFLLNESGWKNLELCLQEQFLMFFCRIISRKKSSLAGAVMSECIASFPKHQWLSVLKSIAVDLKLVEFMPLVAHPDLFKQTIKKATSIFFQASIKNILFESEHDTPQMKFYVSLDPPMGPQPYLEYRFAPLRHFVTLMRGHYITGNNSLQKLFNCYHCNQIATFNVYHILFICPIFESDREIFCNTLAQIMPLDDARKFWILGSENALIRRFLHKDVLVATGALANAVVKFLESIMKTFNSQKRLLIPLSHQLTKKRKR
jgi:hypothetical protein